ncbi:hypothetical protein ZOSMA_463G00040 [Zostera marina]|uniref:Uncharacterized protein n=1 Tax=Zostera marina TaxID=29655 RepID=A0A0K9P2J5_ZOSMR|nr:hypothetical protein ZOSMA_463G00040 [Zostera marina]
MGSCLSSNSQKENNTAACRRPRKEDDVEEGVVVVVKEVLAADHNESEDVVTTTTSMMSGEFQLRKEDLYSGGLSPTVPDYLEEDGGGAWKGHMEENGEATSGKESMENPLVSLECFIFL